MDDTCIMMIDSQQEKARQEMFLRRLWQICFGDPVWYERFYFSCVYPGNCVLSIQDKGMLHLNPYRCMINGREQLLHYIVGVATDPSHRREGIMRRLLEHALDTLYGREEPFTYLMPSDTAYYLPFDFVSISERIENSFHLEETDLSIAHRLQIKRDNLLTNVDSEITGITDDLVFADYETLMDEVDVDRWFFDKIDQILSGQYQIYPKHDRAYFDLLMQEKCCQQGRIVVCFRGKIAQESLLGFFAYIKNGDQIVVEQYVLPQGCMEQCLRTYGIGTTSVVHRYPYMVRVVHMERFLSYFASCFGCYEGKRILIRDELICDNCGIYQVKRIGQTLTINKTALDGTKYDLQLSPTELVETVFQTNADSPVEAFFAEIV